MGNNFKENIILSIKKNTFFEFILDNYSNNRADSTLVESLIELHNKNIINVLQEFSKLTNDGFGFFQIRDVLGQILPKIDASIKDAKKVVEHLTVRAGNDMASHRLISPFIVFCSKDEQRVIELLELSLEKINDFDHISTALIAGFKINNQVYFDKAITLISHENDSVKQRAIFALGRFDYSSTQELAERAMSEIFGHSKCCTDDLILSEQLGTIIQITSEFQLSENYLSDFLELHKKHTGEKFLHKIAANLQFKKLSRDIQTQMFSFFSAIKIENTRTIDCVDWYLYNKVGETLLTEHLEFLLDNTKQTNWISLLPNTKQKIQKEEFQPQLSEIITKWFLNKKSLYCLACKELLSTGTTDQLEISFDATNIKNSDLAYLANKSIGWLYIHAKTVTSLIISLIPLCDEEQLNEIEEVFLKILYFSFPGTVREELDKHLSSKEEKVVLFVKKMVQKHEEYWQILSPLFEIQEMRPSNRQRIQYQEKEEKMWEEMNKKSDTGFLTSLLFKNQVLLYGSKAICHIKANGQSHRQVLPLNKMSISTEMPKLPILEPHVLEYNLDELKYKECDT